ncbi:MULTISPECIES: cation diffusion facilitator family transporter [unclassified Sinorhizobium]|uniref:cation diffusion facilitator family transporter n=1 Tax=unclassified Sinorhizobium TaxID=2613772 RepID=UPI0035231E83
MWSEQGFLRASIVATVIVALFGIVFGLVSGSFSIAFDGVYSLADAGMTILALWVSSLIVRSARGDAMSGRIRNRFTMGFWHLEPIVLMLNGALLIAVAIYALINAIINIMNGGHDLRFGVAIVYAAVTLAICTIMAAAGRRVNRRLQSDFVALDVKAWIMSGGITLALLVAFIIGYALEGTSAGWLSPYVDPVVLALVCLVIIPLPVGTVWQALSDILLITPVDLKAHVDHVAAETVRRMGFLSYRAYVAKVGRATQIELYFIVPPGLPPKSVEEWDAVRDEIGAAIGDESVNRWLTIAFTADAEWAE